MDYNKFITRDDLDLDKYNSKFKDCEIFLKKSSPSNSELGRLCIDPTTFCYLNFKLDDVRLRPYGYQDLIMNDSHRYIYFRAANQIGKAELVENLIPTPNGFVKMGDLKVGDEVFSQDGDITKIINIPFIGTRPCYGLTFDDESYIEVAKEHLWICKTEKERFRKKYKHNRGKKKGQIYDNPNYNKWKVMSTEEIIEKGKYDPGTIPRLKISIPVCQPIKYYPKLLNISPYVLGLLLGDGCLSEKGASFSSGDVSLMVELKKECDMKILNYGSKKYVMNLSKELRIRLEKYNLIGTESATKFIPMDFLTGDIQQRTDLLKGLMDTDGSVYGNHSTLEYCTVSERLKNDFVELINSLGGVINKVTEKNPFYYNKDREKVFCKKAYSIRFRIDINPFKLKRKVDKFKPVTKYRKERLIERIEYVGDYLTKCISVDSKDNSYLSSFNYIVTHNSLCLDMDAAYNFIKDHGHAFNAAIISKSLPQSIFQMRRIKHLLRTARFDWAENEGTKSMSVITFDVKDDEGNIRYTNLLICCPCTEGTLGYDLHKVYLDEFEYWDVEQKYFFNRIAQPRTYTTKGQIMITSNPNGQDNFAAELEVQTLPNGNKKWHVYVFDYLDKPGNSQEEYDQLKNELPRADFESTVAAVRTTSDRNYFTPDEIERSYDKKLTELQMVGKQPVFFLDVGAKHDQSVLVGGFVELDDEKKDIEGRPLSHVNIVIVHVYPIGYPLTRVVGVTTPDEDGWHYEKSVKEHIIEWTKKGVIPTFGVDVTGNSGISPLFETVGLYPQDITFSGPSKSGMYQRFKYFMEKGLIHRIKSKEWAYQAAHLEVKKSMRGYLMFHHSSEEDLDDCMDSTAGLIHLADSPEIVEPSLVVF